MTLISVARIGIKIAKRIDARYRYLDPTNKFIQKYVPPGYRARAFKAKRIADVAIGGGVLYDVLSEITKHAQVPRKATTPYKARSGFKYNSSRNFKYGRSTGNRKRRCVCFKRYQRRSYR